MWTLGHNSFQRSIEDRCLAVNFPTATISAIASQCAPNIAAETVAAIVHTESLGNPLALNVNGPHQPRPQKTTASAVTTARRYISAGYSVDLGLGQINSRNMRKLGLSWDTVFDPCTNIAALGQILTQNYRAVAGGRHPQTALRLALSLYNTGSRTLGFRNGYVAKVVKAAGLTDGAAARHPEATQIPAGDSDDRRAIAHENTVPTGMSAKPFPRPPEWAVFERAASARDVFVRTVFTEGSISWTGASRP
jgi:type IV secretion system protein VirB1